MNYPESHDSLTQPTPTTIRSSAGGLSPAITAQELIKIVQLLESKLGLGTLVPFTADSGTDVFTATGHGMNDGDVVIVQSTGALPTGLSTLTRYFVVNKTPTTFQLSTTSGGSPLNITTNGTGTHSFIVLIGIGKALVGALGGKSTYSVTMPPSGLVVGETDGQTLSSKSLIQPAIDSFVNAAHNHTNSAGGGQLDIAALSFTAQQFLVPTGTILIYGNVSGPTGYLLCNGDAVSRATYTTLFGVIGTTFGAGNGTTTFNVPDLRQRFPLGKAVTGTGNALGSTGGLIDHIHPLGDEGQAQIVMAASNPGMRSRRLTAPFNWTSNLQAVSTAASASSVVVGSGTPLMGNTQAANPPFLAVNFIIKI